MNFLAQICVGRPLLGWILVCLLGVPPTLGFLGVRIADPLPSGWVAPEVIEELRRAERDFRSDSRVVVVLECEDFFESGRIQALHSTVRALRNMEEVRNLTWMGDIPEVNLRGQQRMILPDADTSGESPNFSQAKQSLLVHPLVVNQLLSNDAKTALLLIDARNESDVETIRSVAVSYLSSHGIRARITGTLALYAVHNQALAQDHIRIQFIAYALVGALLILIFRRPMAIIVAGSGPVVGVVWTMGWLQLTGQSENELAKIILPVMVLMIGFTDGVHLVTRLRQLRSAGVDLQASVRQAIQQTGPACLLTSLTTAIGFGSLMLSQSEMIAGFGRVAAIGVVVTFLAVILVSPLLAVSPVGRRMHVRSDEDSIPQLMNRLVGIVGFSTSHARIVSVAGVAITIACLGVSSRLIPDDRVSDRVPQKSEELAAMIHCDMKIGGVRRLNLIVQWPESAAQSEIWTVLRKCEELIENQPDLGTPLSVRTALSVFTVSDPEERFVLASRLPDHLKRRFYRPDLRSALVVTRMQDVGIAKFDPVFQAIQRELTKIEASHSGFSIEFMSDIIIEGRVVRQIIDELLQSLTLAAGIIFITLAIAFRSLRLGLISIIPNIMPLAASGAIRMALGSSIGIAGACSFAICLGIAVDDTIHYLSHFQRERRNGYSVDSANRRTFVSVGSALMLTTVVMTAGLATVMTSQLPPHMNFAAMACTTLLMALPADLLFLPALLRVFPGHPTKDDRESAQSTQNSGDQPVSAEK